MQILNSTNGVVANYSYDAWGNLLEVTDANEKVITSTTNFALINPIRYRGYYYDSETGFYYLKSRYYDPANCRFISADSQIDLNSGTTNLNLFAYCGNDPVNRVDPNGEFWIIIPFLVIPLLLSSCSKKTDSTPLPYSSADDAARAFANETYSSSLYIRHEYGTAIYSKTSNEKTTFNYTEPVSGTPHSVGINTDVPKGTTLVATAHTHPNSNAFSDIDMQNAIRRGVDNYVVGPSLTLQKFEVSTKIIYELDRISPVALTVNQQRSLVDAFRVSWNNHLGSCYFGCEYMDWPTP